uniref:Uncharacterized protein n=1 Tax=Theropithecus gelada TaxID=9565 RepID=A0A8D2G8P1_THEGE
MHRSFQFRRLQTATQAAQMDVSLLSLLGDGFTSSLPAFGCRLASFGQRTPSLGSWTAPRATQSQLIYCLKTSPSCSLFSVLPIFLSSSHKLLK